MFIAKTIINISSNILGQGLEVTQPAHSYTYIWLHASKYLVKVSHNLFLTSLWPDHTTKQVTRKGVYGVKPGRQRLRRRLKTHGFLEEKHFPATGYVKPQC